MSARLDVLETAVRGGTAVLQKDVREVREGVAPFMMVPGSLQAARAASASMPAEEQETVDGMLCRTMLPARLRELGVQAVVDANPAGREVHLGEGDMLLLDPMTTQCVSRPRHQLLAR